METIIYALFVVIIVAAVRALFFKSSKISVPACYHCETKDEMKYHLGNFYCGSCGKVIDGEYMLHYHQIDLEYALRGPEHYEKFKKLRREVIKRKENQNVE